MFNLPNTITLIRILLIPLFVLSLLNYHETGDEFFRRAALFLFIAAGVSDALDGFFARVRNQRTTLGSFLDPLADKALLITAVVMLSLPMGRLTRLPSWFPVLVVSRDAIIVLGSLLIHMLTGRMTPRPSIWGKCATGFQMITVGWVLCRIPQQVVPLSLAAVFTAVSGFDYIYQGMRQMGSPGD
ncbi:MAG: CDP-diacylglycerol--glycerol-3-phosphate 3-phosphatidyltransferase [Candidatus Aureabacteria bacterium]|nr:CDP-diacylglycerol--glycerol-3-phosphate 3-phosphatidyltransferase [Candidatus Auribacterota bacterium]